MFRNLVVVTFRNLFRHRFFSIINLLGLSIGFGACLVIWLYVTHERSYDSFHVNADRIYRINQTFIWGDDDALFSSTGPAVRQAIADQVPEFEQLTRLHTPGSSIISSSNESNELMVFDEENILAADDNFFDIFSFELAQGNPNTALSGPNSVVITETTAKKFFNEKNALGQELVYGEGARSKTLKITGVVKDIPLNSHIQFDYLISMATYPRIKQAHDSWMWTTFVTFGLLRSDANPEVVATKVADVPGKYLEAFLQKYRGISYEEFLASGETWDLYMQPLKDVHLSSGEVYSRLSQTSNKQVIYILLFVGALIFSLSMINYVNLSTAKATTRAKEVGVRKVIGSSKLQLIRQFLFESLLYVLIASATALLLVESTLPFINDATGLALSLVTSLQPQNWILFGMVVLGVSMISSIYPAWILSSFSPSSVLKTSSTPLSGGNGLRNALVAIQFSISILMIASTLIISDQVNFLKNLDLGFDRNNQLVVRNVQRLNHNLEPFAEELRTYAQVEHVSISSDTPPMIFDFDNFYRDGDDNINLAVNYLTADEHFLDTYDLNLIKGRNLSRAFNDSLNIVVNRQFLKSFQLGNPEEALKQKIKYNQSEFTIVGVMDDFETSLSNQTYPTAILDPDAPIFRNPKTHITVKMSDNLTGDQMKSMVATIQELWNQNQQQLPFDYTFADQEYNELFQENIQFGKLMGTLAVLSIVIACLGLIGLVAFVLEKRKKEIGIRKVLGASIHQIWMMLSRSFGWLMLIGLFVGGSMSWIIMQNWVAEFAVRKELTIWPVIFSGVIMLGIALGAVSMQIINAARVNPVDYLHEE
jgi:putative ABC transport system permease protein